MAANLLEEIAKNGKNFITSGDDASRQAIIASAARLIVELENPMEQTARIGWGQPTRSVALWTCFKLGLFKKLLDKPMSGADLAEGTPADPKLVCTSS